MGRSVSRVLSTLLIGAMIVLSGCATREVKTPVRRAFSEEVFRKLHVQTGSSYSEETTRSVTSSETTTEE